VVALPTVFVAARVTASADLVAMIKLLGIAAFVWHAAAFLRGSRAEPWSRLALAAAGGLLWAAVLAMVAYQAVALDPFNFEEVVSSLYDARRTLVLSLGPHGVTLTVGAFAALLLVFGATAWALYRWLPAAARRLAPGPRGAVLCLGLLCYFGANDLWYVVEQLVVFRKVDFARKYLPAPRFPDYSAAAIRPGDSVFIVQLESVNADALFVRARGGAPARARVAQPGLETILKEGRGSLFPLFWANGTRTNRAWETILCAVSGNVGEALSPARLARRTCLPEQLARAGYATVFFYSYFELEFFNFGAIARQAGFREVAYGQGLMAEGDRRHRWAFDDCVFYRRAFERLAQRPRGERMLAYFEVGMNHVPFETTAKYPEAHHFRPAKNTLEGYVNSLAEQDHCLLEFWRLFRQLGRDDVHLFVLPDHSMLVSGIPAEEDTVYATWLAYVPPARRAAEFPPRTVVAPVPSQAQLFPTILELLGAPPATGSFAFALRGEPAPPHYDDCHMMGRHAVSLVVRRRQERAEYRLYSGEAVLPDGSVVRSDLNSFQERFACR